MANVLHTYISELERDRSLLEPSRLRERIDALDRMETYLTCGLHQHCDAEPGSEGGIRDKIETVCARLEAANHRLCQTIRAEIRSGKGACKLLEWAPAPDDRVDGEGYDHLDALVSGVLQIDEPAEVAELVAEMVFYQPTPARHIFDFIDRVELRERDVLIDLGAGLGHVPLLAAICTDARCIGVEREAAYVDCARRCAKALNLNNATFVQQDARMADLSAGTVFYLYTPFTGAMLSQMLHLLRREAADREIRICTLGPCTPTVAREPWLEVVGTQEVDRPSVFRSV
ncbi:hypothetical protein [Dokdonella soli]|uniref:DOT1 domain-containing protein n=1 Tax=Dokdonella soli TaxID=529810 RepID=A0ABP3TN69_9GAMM